MQRALWSPRGGKLCLGATSRCSPGHPISLLARLKWGRRSQEGINANLDQQQLVLKALHEKSQILQSLPAILEGPLASKGSFEAPRALLFYTHSVGVCTLGSQADSRSWGGGWVVSARPMSAWAES